MNNEQIKHMVERFLSWKLPENFNPDGGIRFERMRYKDNLHPMPTGTNLLDAVQAEEMVRYMIESIPKSALVCTCPTNAWIGSEPNDSTCELSEEEHDELSKSEVDRPLR